MKRPSAQQAGIGIGALVVVVVVVWMLSKGSSSSTSGRSWSRAYESQGIPFGDAASDGQPTVGIYGIDWY